MKKSLWVYEPESGELLRSIDEFNSEIAGIESINTATLHPLSLLKEISSHEEPEPDYTPAQAELASLLDTIEYSMVCVHNTLATDVSDVKEKDLHWKVDHSDAFKAIESIREKLFNS
jgi:hypothetical protein